MAICEQCGNDYGQALEIAQNGTSHIFDCFECAIAAMAPICRHCGCKVIGHGVERNGATFCCPHCADAIHHAAVS